jgi:hypothetical protein
VSAEDDIQINLSSDVSEGEKARRKLQDIEQQSNDLRSSFEQGRMGLERYNKELRNLEGQAKRAQAALDKIQPAKAVRLTGTDRAGAISRAGLLGANTLQDVLQGGPASGINNVLGAANDRGIKALAGEALAAAGGIKVVAGAFGTLAIAAGAAFLTIEGGLKQANLGWQDLDEVIGEVFGSHSGPIKGTIDALGSIYETTVKIGGSVASLIPGWDKATNAVREHKNEIERNSQALKNYQQAQKNLSGFKSEAQQKNEAAGKLFGAATAELGGEKGIDGVLDKLAEHEVKAKGQDPNKTVIEKGFKKDKDGNDTSEVAVRRVTLRQLAKERLAQELNDATQGSQRSMDAFTERLAAGGFNAGDVASASAGADMKSIRKEAKDQEEAQRKAQVERSTQGLQERFNVLTAQGQAPQLEGVQRQLERSGLKPEEAARSAEAVLKNLREGFNQEIGKRAQEKGLNFSDAAADFLKEHNETYEREQKAKHDRAVAVASEKASKATAGTGLDSRTDNALIREALKSGGSTGVATQKVAEQLSREFQVKGLSKQDADLAANDMAKKHAAKLGDQINEEAMKPGNRDRDKLDAPQRIASTEFARSVEAAGSDDAKMANGIESMDAKMKELVDLVRKGPRLVK